MPPWRRALGVALVVAVFASGAHAGTSRARTAAATDVLTVGALLDLKSGWTTLGRASRVTLRLAVTDANARLARRGSRMRVRLRIIDVHGDPPATLRALRRLAAAGVRIVIGPQASSEVRAVRAAANSLGVVLISQGSTAHSLAVGRDNVFRFVPDDLRESEALVALLRRDGVDAVVPVSRRDAGNAGLADAVGKRFRRTGGSVADGVRYGTDVSDFAPTLDRVRTQVGSLRAEGASRPAVYLAAFDEVVGLFERATMDPFFGSLPWYGSDGVALSPRLVGSQAAASFAASVGYPNPILGLRDAAARRSRQLVGRIEARLGRTPDAFALTAYDALEVAVDASTRAGALSDPARLRRAVAAVADGYNGTTGKLVLNAAGDRAFGSYDFWSICAGGASAEWRRSASYLATAPNRGRIVSRQAC